MVPCARRALPFPSGSGVPWGRVPAAKRYRATDCRRKRFRRGAADCDRARSLPLFGLALEGRRERLGSLLRWTARAFVRRTSGHIEFAFAQLDGFELVGVFLLVVRRM